MTKLDERLEEISHEQISFEMIVGWSPDGKDILNWRVYLMLGGEVTIGELWLTGEKLICLDE